jgi:hypothetical protein
MQVLNIRSQQPQIGIETQRGKLDMTAPQAKLNIDNATVKVDMHTVPAKLEIDQYPSRASYGVISITDSISQQYQKAKQQAQEGIARRVQEGNQFLSSNASHVIASRVRSSLSKMPEMKVGLCQVTPPTIKYMPGKVEVEPKLKKVSLKVDSQPVDVNYTPADVKVYLKQKAEVKMWVSEDQYDIYA